MGEKIYFRRRRDSDDSAQGQPRPVVPLEYAGPGCRGWWAALNRRLLPILDLCEAHAARMMTNIGGPRQIVFAAGIALLLGGVGSVIDPWGDAAVWLVLGGLFIGLVARLPERWR